MPIDYKDYPDDWEAISLRIRNERAGGCCEDCRAPNGAWIRRSKANGYIYEVALEDECEDGLWKKPVRVVLTVAHVGAPKPDGSIGDKHDKHDVREENLRALCQRCHLRLDLNDHQTNRRNGRNWRRDQTSLPL